MRFDYRGNTQFSAGYAYATTAAIAGTTDDRLYESERNGNFSYDVPVENGDYLVRLKFAEIHWTQPRHRIFNLRIERARCSASSTWLPKSSRTLPTM